MFVVNNIFVTNSFPPVSNSFTTVSVNKLNFVGETSTALILSKERVKESKCRVKE